MRDTTGETRTTTCDVLLWNPSLGRASVGRTTTTSLQKLWEDTVCRLENLTGAMGDRDEYIYIYIYIYIRGAYDNFPDFFIWELLLIVHTWNSSPLRSTPLRLQCTCTAPTTSGRPHGSPLVWVCQRPSSQPLSSTQLYHNDSLWA